ncbi:DgyrCDS7747 [Dimorphilus gyrociliatus]|uniref:NEDD8-activating enzyme E1 regulatory subunit n=1 Tax=Dimorphilus gyrociliatus TaxID=2664684 RepID=A0A7I8VUJ1_9ANNE|nr:DgyrCDS7747 [Dimorphilus gyrociliatus]
MSGSISPSKPVDKSNKYDRQLRLWGDQGQSKLEKARICLINATATGTEILKNLILPGIGSFTIVDGHKVSGEDVGNNFFLEKSAIGKNRGQVACELLQELNDDVLANYVDENVEDLFQVNAKFFSTFSVVIATDLNERTLLQISSYLWSCKVPFLHCVSYGFIGYMRIAMPVHTVIESHPDNALDDLRLDRPFKEFRDLCDACDLGKMNVKEHSHIPWLIVVYKYLEIWKNKNNGNIPKTYQEKQAFKKLIRSGILLNKDGNPEMEENFDEAIRNVNTALSATKMPDDVKHIFEDPECINIVNKSEPFWILVRAVKEFVKSEGEGFLPLRGVIPDMTSDSDSFIRLQQVYRNKASKDVEAVNKHLQNVVSNLSIPCIISEAEIRNFCKNAAFLRVLRYRSISEEYNSPSTIFLRQMAQRVEDEDDDLVYYVLLRAVSRYYLCYSNYPGIYEVEDDIMNLKSCVTRLLQQWKITCSIKDDLIHEFCRYGACEMHSIAAYMGGCAAQEAIKLITGQYVPFNNTFIYNAMKQTSVTVEL